MNRKDILFIVVCILAIATVVVFVFVSAAIYKKTEAGKNPYYYCDGDWICCNEANCDVPTSKNLEVTKSLSDTDHVKNLKDSSLIYKPADYWAQGSNYHQNCVLPVQNAILNYKQNSTQTFEFASIYNGNETYGATGTNNPSIFGIGCTGYGGATGTKCADPKYNVQVLPSCPYVSIDGADNNAPNTPGIAGGTTYSLTGATGAGLPGGAVVNTSNSYTLNPTNWASTGNLNTFSGVTPTSINYGCNGLTTTNLQNCQGANTTKVNSIYNLMNPSYVNVNGRPPPTP